LFIQQWHVNDINIAGTHEKLFVPASKKMTLLKNLVSIYGSYL